MCGAPPPPCGIAGAAARGAAGAGICARAFTGGPPRAALGCVVGRGTLDPRRSRTRFVMTAGHDRRRLRAGSGHRLLAHGRSCVFTRHPRVLARHGGLHRAFVPFARATRSNVFLPRHAFRHTGAGPLRHGARPFLDTGTRPLLDTDTRLCLGERSVARCRRAADPGRRAVDRQPRRETLMRLPVAAPVGAAVIPAKVL